jgi:archaellum biogenesis protein FlaJ (TadC family)
MLTLIIASIVLQVLIGIALLYLVRIHVTEDETDKAGTKRSHWADRINNWVVASIFLLTVINIFISAFGLGEVEKTSAHTTTSPTLPVKKN